MRHKDVRVAVMEQVGRWLEDALTNPPDCTFGEEVQMKLTLTTYEGDWTLRTSSSRTTEIEPPRDEEDAND